VNIEYPDWMNENQKKCYRMLCDLVGGPHHIRGKITDTCGYGIQTNVSTDWATFDGCSLTSLVVLAHDRGIRASLEPLNMQYMRLTLYARQGRTGRVWQRHPTLECHVDAMRKAFSTDDNMPEDLAAPESDAAGGGK
jgi:hypothetical protein